MLVLDAKRGDIGSTAEHYAREAFDRYGADAVTVNPYLGTDAATPFLERGGVLAVCRTSNPGSGDLQDLPVDGTPLYQRVARMVAERWAPLGECGLVVGATFPRQLAEVRAIVGDLPILVPAVGEQRGDLAAVRPRRLDRPRHGPHRQLVAGDPVCVARRGFRRSGPCRGRSRRETPSAPSADLGGFRAATLTESRPDGRCGRNPAQMGEVRRSVSRRG